MASNRPKLKVWEGRVSVAADAALRDSVLRVTSKRPEMWGYMLAGLRAARGWSLAAQAMALGVPESAVVFLSVCRLPRPGRCDEDLETVADRMGISPAVLRFVLDLATESSGAGNCITDTGGVA